MDFLVMYHETKWAAFDVIMLDNAKSHLAQNVIYKLKRRNKMCY